MISWAFFYLVSPYPIDQRTSLPTLGSAPHQNNNFGYDYKVVAWLVRKKVHSFKTSQSSGTCERLKALFIHLIKLPGTIFAKIYLHS